MKRKKFAVVLSGCGVYDGAEIHEAVISLLEIKRQGGEYEIFAPNMKQFHVINHLNGEVMPEERNVLVESARIARGKINDLKDFHASDFDVLFFPGGFGAAKNLSDFALNGDKMTVHPEVERVIMESVENNLFIGALCIAPVLFANLLEGATVTIGQDQGTAGAIEGMGGFHETTNHAEVVIDEKYKLYTTPCYMLDANILDIAEGVKNLVAELMDSL
jgi:enhancing lycopene biosynthesis protein 2